MEAVISSLEGMGGGRALALALLPSSEEAAVVAAAAAAAVTAAAAAAAPPRLRVFDSSFMALAATEAAPALEPRARREEERGEATECGSAAALPVL